MASNSGETLSSKSCAALRMENKRKLDERASRNWDGNMEAVPRAHVPSCSDARPSLSEFDLVNQSVAEIVAQSFAKFKRPRTEDMEHQSEPVRTNELDLGVASADNCFKADHDQLAKETLPMHPRHFHQGAQWNNRENLNQPRKVDVQNLKQASAGGARVISDLGGPSGSPVELFQLKRTNDGISVFMDSAGISRVLSQGSARTFALKIFGPSLDSTQIPNCELRWELG